jgi:hypothetical protein
MKTHLDCFWRAFAQHAYSADGHFFWGKLVEPASWSEAGLSEVAISPHKLNPSDGCGRLDFAFQDGRDVASSDLVRCCDEEWI